MYFALGEFFLQRTQQYTHIKNLVNAPVSAIGWEKDITLCKPLHAILNERSKEDFRFGSHLCLLTRGEEAEHYKIKQPIRQKSPLLGNRDVATSIPGFSPTPPDG